MGSWRPTDLDSVLGSDIYEEILASYKARYNNDRTLSRSGSCLYTNSENQPEPPPTNPTRNIEHSYENVRFCEAAYCQHDKVSAQTFRMETENFLSSPGWRNNTTEDDVYLDRLVIRQGPLFLCAFCSSQFQGWHGAIDCLRQHFDHQPYQCTYLLT